MEIIRKNICGSFVYSKELYKCEKYCYLSLGIGRKVANISGRAVTELGTAWLWGMRDLKLSKPFQDFKPDLAGWPLVLLIGTEMSRGKVHFGRMMSNMGQTNSPFKVAVPCWIWDTGITRRSTVVKYREDGSVGESGACKELQQISS